MDNSRRQVVSHKIHTLLGFMFLLLPGDIAWYWGTISVYVLSFISSGVSSADSLDVTWIIALFNMLWIVVLFCVTPMTKYVGRRWISLAGAVVVSSGLFLSYFAVQKSLAWLALSLSGLLGLGQGLLFGNALYIVTQTANNDIGLLSSFLLSAPSLGGVVFSQIGTWYVNPANKATDHNVGPIRYFTDEDIIHRVPSMFLILGGVSLALQLIGMVILQANPSMRFVHYTNCSGRSLLNGQVTNYTGANDDPVVQTQSETSGQDTSSSADRWTSKDRTPKEMLCTPEFYTLWISIFFVEISYFFLLNFFKLYGQIWIHDDHFLTYLGTTFMIIISLSRVPWGFALDKLGCKLCLMILSGSVVVIMPWYYFSAMVNRWLYFLASLLYGVLSGNAYTCYTASAGLLFGRTHITTNTGILLLSALIAIFCAPFLIDVVLTNFGWFTMFASVGGFNLIGLLLCMIFLP